MTARHENLARRAAAALAVVLTLAACTPGSPSSPPTTTRRQTTAAPGTDLPIVPEGPQTDAEWTTLPQITDLPQDGSVQLGDEGSLSPARTRTYPLTGSVAELVSPDGKIACTLDAQGATCTFAAGTKPPAEVPDPAAYCTTSTSITGVRLSRLGNAWLCEAAPLIAAVPNTPETAWAGTSPTTVRAAGGTAVALPTEHGIRAGIYQCVSRDNGISCDAGTLGSGFRVHADGPTFWGTRPGTRSQY